MSPRICPSRYVYPYMQNLERNSFMHTQQFIFPVAVATIKYIVQRVRNPPPWIFLSSPELYLAQVHNATGIALIETLRHCGLPTIEWLQAARECNGLHVDRCEAHGPQRVYRLHNTAAFVRA